MFQNQLVITKKLPYRINGAETAVQMDFPALENCGKEIWMTEVYVPNSHANSNNIWSEAIQVSENIHNGLVVGNMSAYVWWYIRRSYSPMSEDGSISKPTSRQKLFRAL